MTAPVFTILAGPNGSGKSTLTEYLREEFQDGAVLDPDAFSRSIRDTEYRPESAIEAGRRILQRAEGLLAARQGFTVETTLSGSTYLRMAARARELGYLVALVFVGTESIEINIERIRSRVVKGGHDVPLSDQRRRYPRSFRNAQRLMEFADFLVLLDNSSEDGYSLVAEGRMFDEQWIEPLPEWAKPFRRYRSRLVTKPGTQRRARL